MIWIIFALAPMLAGAPCFANLECEATFRLQGQAVSAIEQSAKDESMELYFAAVDTLKRLGLKPLRTDQRLPYEIQFSPPDNEDEVMDEMFAATAATDPAKTQALVEKINNADDSEAMGIFYNHFLEEEESNRAAIHDDVESLFADRIRALGLSDRVTVTGFQNAWIRRVGFYAHPEDVAKILVSFTLQKIKNDAGVIFPMKHISVVSGRLRIDAIKGHETDKRAEN